MTPANIELLAVQYPGRADRIAEAPVGDIPEMGTRVAEELAELEPSPLVLFGHSLGALVAYETAVTMRDKMKPADHLFVSGSPAPRHAGGGHTHQLPDNELWSAVADLGGMDPDVAADPELRELLLPALRSDVTANETYRLSARSQPLDCPVHCYHNTDDPLVDAAELDDWAGVSTGRFTLRTWPGGHFQFLSDTADLVADIVAALAAEVAR